MTVVPIQLRIEGPHRPHFDGDTTSRCRICNRTIAEHSRIICAICRAPIEHHVDPDLMQLEIDGRARMAVARLHAGLNVDGLDEWCIDYSSDEVAA